MIANHFTNPYLWLKANPANMSPINFVAAIVTLNFFDNTLRFNTKLTAIITSIKYTVNMKAAVYCLKEYNNKTVISKIEVQ